MSKIIAFLKGKKTYIVAALLFIASGGAALGWWTMDQAKMVDLFLIPLGLGFLRSSVNSPK